LSANIVIQETELVDAAVSWLSGSLPRGWAAQRSTWNVVGPNGREPTTIDPVITLKGSNSTATFVVEAKRSVSPRDVERLMAGLSRTLRTFANVSVLVVAPWLSARTQELLRKEEINYVDLTGNAWVRADYPAVFIRTVGATRNPEPAAREAARLRGPKAGRLVRALVDVRPPYGVRELAESIGLTAGYVSRLLDSLDRDALVDRSRKGEVAAVDYSSLLRRWVETYDVLKSNEARRFVAPEVPRKSLLRLKSSPSPGRVAVTGSFAAGRIAPVAAPSLLLAYATDIAATADALNLLPADEGANVILLCPYDEAVWSRLDRDDGISYVAPSQAAADCLTGTGRMPAEGEALLAWMVENERRWRVPSLRDFVERDRSA
jgi:DNA-binding transcriptional ArsR family regulator